ncbi:MAG: TonB-dependent receptor [Sphingomonadales bacterium]|nr:TonB-dependent receptor [Sphingomonadales bacterium]MDE2569723.1 TonB-dependent receptor [Sphingomonadales bacterium]
MKFAASIVVGMTALASGVVLPQVALAQEAAQSTEEAPPGAIIVTAQRRAESVQDVPIAIAAISGEMVEASGNTDITSLNGQIPNVVLQTEGLIANIPMISIRGMSTADPDPNSEPKVSTVIDGVYVPFAAGTMLDMFDIDRVEVLKGPQGVLFGKNNLAGTINIITSRPTNDAGAEVRGTFGSFGLKQIRAKVNTGLFANGKLALKIAGNLRDYDGYNTNVITGTKLNATNSKSLRGAMKFDGGGAFNSILVVDWLKEHTIGPGGHTVDNGSAAYQLLPLAARTDVRKSAIVFDPVANTETYGASWTSNLDVGAGTITAVLGYRHLTYFTHGDYDGLTVPVPGLDVTRDFTGSSGSAEVRFVSETGKLIDYVLGLYYETDTWTQNNTVLVAPPVKSLAYLHQKTKSYAGFALFNIHPTEQLTLSLGGRYSHDQKNYAIDARVFANNVFVPPSSFADSSFDNSWSQFTPRAVLQYKPSRDVMLYASYSKGYKSGGYNSRGTIASNVGPYNPETVNAYELGLKSELFDRKLRFNVAAFLNNFKNLQGAVTKMGALRPENVTVNIASARTYGLEMDAGLRASRNLTINATFAYLHARYTSFCADTDGVFTGTNPNLVPTNTPGQCGTATPVYLGTAFQGFSIPVDSTNLDMANAPEYTASLGFDYKFPVGMGTINLHGDGRYSSRYNTWGRSNDPAYYRGEVVLLNGSIGLTSATDGWSVTLYGRNLTNQTVMSGAISAGATPITQFYMPPREFGIDVDFKF